MKKGRGCLDQVVFVLLLLLAFGGSSYFWFRFFVRGRSIPTPQLVGRTVAEARALASDRGLELELDNQRDRHAPQIPVGAVAWQNRSAGSLVKRGTRLIVGRSLGPLVLKVPDLSGQSPRTAMLRFSQRNLRLGNISYLPTEEIRGVIAEDPPRETIVDGQTAVSLLVGFEAPPPAWVMPDLIDRSLDEVRPALESHRLEITNVRFETYPGIPDGTIIRQFPLGGYPVSQRDPISLVVSRQEQTNIFEQP